MQQRERGGEKRQNKIIEWEEMEEGRGKRRGKKKGRGKGRGKERKEGKGKGKDRYQKRTKE